MKSIKLILVVKVLFVIWLSAFLINTASSSSFLYSIGSIGFRSFVNSINRTSGELMSMSGLLLYPIILLWCVLNYQKIKAYLHRLLTPLVTKWKAKKEINDSRANYDLLKKTTLNVTVGYFSLFLFFMLFVDNIPLQSPYKPF